MRAVFLGTPEAGAVALRALLESAHDVVAVVTQPDRQRGRSGTPQPSAVKRVALDAGREILQPESPRDERFAERLRTFAPDVLAVVAYGHILPVPVLEVARAINAHFSLLPRYRGAAPVQRAIQAGERTTGVTTFLLEPAVDTGPILLQEKIAIGDDETAGELLARLAPAGARLLVASIDALEVGTLEPAAQDPAQASPAPKITPAEAEIDWSQPARRIHDTVRAFNPAPGAWTTHDGRRLKVWRSRLAGDAEKTGEIGPGPSLVVSAASGALELVEVQPEGKRHMSGEDYLRGLRANAPRFLGPKP